MQGMQGQGRSLYPVKHSSNAPDKEAQAHHTRTKTQATQATHAKQAKQAKQAKHESKQADAEWLLTLFYLEAIE